jgi:hypothetical protein
MDNNRWRTGIMGQIKKPEKTTWFITYDDKKKYFAYGVVNKSQRMDTGLNNIEYFYNENEYLKRCEELDINLNKDEEV